MAINEDTIFFFFYEKQQCNLLNKDLKSRKEG